MPIPIRPTTIALGLLLFVVALPVLAKSSKAAEALSPIRIEDIEACPAVQSLNAVKDVFESTAGESPLLKRMFTVLFPFDRFVASFISCPVRVLRIVFSPAYNSLLATFYISSFPNLILGFIPDDIELSSLNTMISFATGGLLGDVFLNLIPHSFLGEPSPEAGVGVVVVEPRRNIVIGSAIFAGFALFFLLDKVSLSLRF